MKAVTGCVTLIHSVWRAVLCEYNAAMLKGPAGMGASSRFEISASNMSIHVLAPIMHVRYLGMWFVNACLGRMWVSVNCGLYTRDACCIDAQKYWAGLMLPQKVHGIAATDKTAPTL